MEILTQEIIHFICFYYYFSIFSDHSPLPPLSGWSLWYPVFSDYFKLSNAARCRNLVFIIMLVECMCCLFGICFQKQVISRIKWENYNYPETLFRWRSFCASDSTANQLKFEVHWIFSSPFGNHGDSTVSSKQSLWERITLEILLFKNNLNLVLTPESWGGAFCQHFLLFRTRKASICVVTGPAMSLGSSTVTVEFF